ncbi:protease [Sandarakinorhabdus cyanobacteriorum]|uniref:Probable periplasmic serine endoprotease DegP-like n=1 Tax=Sandarakinorhabdus cyanobacteriorum TaxID=1981098 RepID=A0A255YE14_9SPHN|nr:Do family serine endopeptidase [Sandarakinorhabdus cyanobacteriorum]OYQ26805.1 protease [Sandarakinorhabdus cyanobacteriorum]
MRNLIPAALLATGVAAIAVAQAPQQGVAQNAVAPATAIMPPGGAPRSFADLTARLAPAVVNVSTTQKVEIGRMRRFPGQPGGNPLEEFFRRFQEQQDGGEPVTREATSLGSGFIIAADGYIVTNNHVISAGEGRNQPVESITVTLADRREYKARVVGRDPLTDLAVLKIEASGLPFVQFGNSQAVRVGDWSIAIGNPFGLGGTVTAGIISALHRDIGSGQYDRYIQTDASINQGNSGGPLFDLNGNVIGINTAIFSPTGGNVGLGFAIPAELAKPVVDQLKATGAVKRGYLGVAIQRLTSDIADGLGLPKDKGEIVANVEPNGPAGRAGVRQGDVILKVAGREVDYDNSLSYIVATTPIGSTVPIELLRDGKRMTINATIAQRPSEAVVAQRAGLPANDDDTPADDATKAPGIEAAKASLGITLQPITAQLRQQLRIDDKVQGVVIAGISPSSDAAAKGLQRGDIILKIGQKPVTSPAEAAAAVDAERKAGKDTVLMLVQRGNTPPTYRGIKLQPVK